VGRALRRPLLIVLTACCWPAAPRAAGAAEEALRPAAIFWSPRSPRSDQPLRVLAVADRPLEATLAVYAPDGTEAAVTGTPHGATPYRWLAEIAAPVAGVYRAGLGRGAEVAVCRNIRVSADPRPRPSERDVVWPVERSWDRDTEDIYSAWVERLFDDPLDAQPSWHGLGDEPPPGAEHGEVSAVARFLRQAVAWTIHSGSARTPAADERTDLYPTRLSTETIRPPGSAEGATCHRRAPREQAGLMEEYRDWFHERRRPPRA